MKAITLSIIIVFGLIVSESAADLQQGAYIIGASGGTITTGDLSATMVLGEPISGTVVTGDLQLKAGFITVYIQGGEVLSVPEEELGIQPQTLTLSNPYPNPFNSTTLIAYYLPTTTKVSLSVFDLSGRQVTSLVNGINQAGKHNVVFQSDDLVSGLYLVRLTTSNRTLTQKVVFVK